MAGRNKFSPKFLSLIGLLIIILISFPLVKNAIKQYKVNKEISDFKKEIASLEDESAELKSFISYLDSDQFAEEEARLNLNLKKSGEELTIIKDNPSNLASTSRGKTIFDIPGYKKDEVKKEFSNPRKWLNYFFK